MPERWGHGSDIVRMKRYGGFRSDLPGCLQGMMMPRLMRRALIVR